MKTNYKYASHEINSLQAKAVKAAAHVLETAGIDRFNLRAIAEEAGIGIASMYHYFKNKDEILLSVALAGYEELKRDMISGLSPPGQKPPSRGVARAFFDFVEKRPILFGVMCNQRLMTQYAALRDAHSQMFQAYETAVMKDERIPEAHRQNVALALCALGQGIAAMMACYPDGALPPDVARRLSAGIQYLVNRER